MCSEVSTSQCSNYNPTKDIKLAIHKCFKFISTPHTTPLYIRIKDRNQFLKDTPDLVHIQGPQHKALRVLFERKRLSTG